MSCLVNMRRRCIISHFFFSFTYKVERGGASLVSFCVSLVDFLYDRGGSQTTRFRHDNLSNFYSKKRLCCCGEVKREAAI